VAKPGLALLDRQPAQILAVEFEQVEGAEHGGVVVAKRTDQLEDRESGLR
jgi:limonene-1,2-epoxide hydrolase